MHVIRRNTFKSGIEIVAGRYLKRAIIETGEKAAIIRTRID